MRIFKYELMLTDKQTVLMPRCADVLSAQVQNGVICVWAFIMYDGEMIEPRPFDIIGTGNPVPEDTGRFVDTIQMDGYVWHIFEG